MDENLDNLLVDEQTSPTNETPEEDNSQNNQTDKVEDPKAKRHAQQLEGSRQEAERLRSIAVESLAKTATVESIQELHKTDPKLANDVAKKFHYESYDDLIRSQRKDGEKEYYTKDDVEKLLAEREAQKEHSKALIKAEKIIGKLSGDDQQEAQARFDKITDGKTLTEEDAIEFAEMATLFVSKKKGSKEEALKQAASTGVAPSKSAPKSDELIVKGEDGFDYARRKGQWVRI